MLQALTVPGACIPFQRRTVFQKLQAPIVRRVTASSTGRDGVKVEYTPWLVVGLGNPGNKYHGTRHNVGFEMIDRISKEEGIVMSTIQSKALIGIGSVGEVPVLLAKPQTYVNFSGESINNMLERLEHGLCDTTSRRQHHSLSGFRMHSIGTTKIMRMWLEDNGLLEVGPLAAYYQVPIRHILVVYDEMSLPNGVLRLQPKGGHGHHNGMKSVMEHLDGCHQFPRLCIGIGNPPGTMDVKAFLLQKFSTEEREQVDEAIKQGAEAVRTLILRGFDDAIDKFNLVQKYKYHKV